MKPIELTDEAKQKLRERDEAIAALFPAPDQAHIRKIMKAGMNEMIGYQPDPDEHEIGIHPAPGTCCPEMLVKDGICQSYGHIHDEKAYYEAKIILWRQRVLMDQGCEKCHGLGKIEQMTLIDPISVSADPEEMPEIAHFRRETIPCPDCEGLGRIARHCLKCEDKRATSIYATEGGLATNNIVGWRACRWCVTCCETCDNWTEHTDLLDGNCLPHDMDTKPGNCCEQFDRDIR
jgi:hypothetical protein